MKRNSLKVSMLLLLPLLMLGCSGGASSTTNSTVVPTAAATPSDPKLDKGVGPVSSLALQPINPSLVKDGEKLFEKSCTACHRIEKRRVGPALSGVTARRSPEWIMNMILNPSEMLEKDAIAKELLAEYATQMANMNITQDQARAILEYLRTKEDPNAKD